MLGIRKQGHGYWVRVLSAVFWGALLLAGAAWAYQEAAAIPLPARSYTMSAPVVSGSANPGTAVTLRRTGNDGKPKVLGSATIESLASAPGGRTTISIHQFPDAKARKDAVDTEEIIAGDPTNPDFRALISANMTAPTPIFEPLYLRALLAGIVLVAGFIGLFWFVGSGRKTTDFLIATDGEMKKVNWSTKKEIRGTTIVVIVASFLIAGFLFLIDQVFATFFKFIDVLQS